MKKYSIIAICFAILMCAASFTLIANAASNQAYGEAVVKCVNWLNPIKDHAYSYVTRNSDLPVDNFLCVTMNIQYQEGNYFKWEDPYFDGGYDIEEARTDRWRYSIMCNTTDFVAESAGCETYIETKTATP